MRSIQRAVVSGLGGFLGAALARRLTADGCDLLGLVRPDGDRRRLASLRNLQLVEWDGRSADSVAPTLRDFRPDVVINLAAYGVQSGETDVERMLSSNIDYAVRLMRAVAGLRHCSLIHTGSCFEYGHATFGSKLTEDASTAPFSAYGATKNAAVNLIRTLAPQWNVSAIVLRPFAVFGPGEASRRLFPSLVRALIEKQPVDLTGGEQVRDFLHVDDLAEAYVRAAQLAFDPSAVPVFNVCSAIPISVRLFGETVAEVLGVPGDALRWGKLPYRAEEPQWIVGDYGRFHQATGWRPRLSLREGLQLCLNDVRAETAPPSFDSPTLAA